jgi:hypothetical protein
MQAGVFETRPSSKYPEARSRAHPATLRREARRSEARPRSRTTQIDAAFSSALGRRRMPFLRAARVGYCIQDPDGGHNQQALVRACARGWPLDASDATPCKEHPEQFGRCTQTEERRTSCSGLVRSGDDHKARAARSRGPHVRGCSTAVEAEVGSVGFAVLELLVARRLDVGSFRSCRASTAVLYRDCHPATARDRFGIPLHASPAPNGRF